jgi:hypothetical protein
MSALARQLVISGLLLVLIPTTSFAQSPQDIVINATMKKGDYVETNLWFQTSNITFGQENKICPQNDCKYEFQDGTFNDYGNTRYVSGTLKIEDKSKSSGKFTSFNYFDVSGTFELQNSQESADQKIFNYSGDLKIEKKADVLANFEYVSKITLIEPANTFLLEGSSK